MPWPYHSSNIHQLERISETMFEGEGDTGSAAPGGAYQTFPFASSRVFARGGNKNECRASGSVRISVEMLGNAPRLGTEAPKTGSSSESSSDGVGGIGQGDGSAPARPAAALDDVCGVHLVAARRSSTRQSSRRRRCRRSSSSSSSSPPSASSSRAPPPPRPSRRLGVHLLLLGVVVDDGFLCPCLFRRRGKGRNEATVRVATSARSSDDDGAVRVSASGTGEAESADADASRARAAVSGEGARTFAFARRCLRARSRGPRRRRKIVPPRFGPRRARVGVTCRAHAALQSTTTGFLQAWRRLNAHVAAHAALGER